MRIFIAGATGVLGRSAVRAMVAAGHDVTGVARGPEKAEALRAAGAEPVSVDLFDPGAVSTALVGHEVVCNFATNIPASVGGYFRRSSWAMNDRLHADASRNLVDSALAAGAGRYLQHSIGFQYADGADRWIDEDAPLEPPPHGLAVVEAERQSQRFTDGGGAGVACRFGYFYGPDASTTRDQLRIARTGFVPFAGEADAFLSWIHTDDLGTAAVAALRAPAGVYNIVDDEPTTRGTFGEILAAALGRKKLRLPPRAMTRLMGKRYDYIKRSLRVSNGRFKSATGWSPTVATARDGWPAAVRALRP